MPKTLKDIYELIKEKRNNAISSLSSCSLEKRNELKGEIDAYYDVQLLIENSGLLEQ